jgi:hypothetical protein
LISQPILESLDFEIDFFIFGSVFNVWLASLSSFEIKQY